MDSSPISSWDGAQAYFTFSDSGIALGVWIVAAVAVVIGVIGATYAHENRSFANLENDK